MSYYGHKEDELMEEFKLTAEDGLELSVALFEAVSLREDEPASGEYVGVWGEDEPEVREDAPMRGEDEPKVEEDAPVRGEDGPEVREDAPKVEEDAAVQQIHEPKVREDAPWGEDEPKVEEDAPVQQIHELKVREDAPMRGEDEPEVEEDAPVQQIHEPKVREDAPVSREDEPKEEEDAPAQRIHEPAPQEHTKKSKAIVQIIHGANEHKERYYDFANYLARHGLTVIISDTRGHGYSVNKDYPLGYMNGVEEIVADQLLITRYVKKRFPNQDVYLVGHSLGSIFARCYLQEHDHEIKKLVLSGTANYVPGVSLALMIGSVLSFFSGKHGYSKILRDMGGNSEDNSWLSYNEENIENYLLDPLCNYEYKTVPP
ncbi:alpha/beta fold hydrolase [Ornithinibacillus sp. BX22]|uniref:Alpha/beta fold hydrolase n=1 Tax=Ornithinibacillus hominis TaxID=2763055 RepID=A0A923L4V5_9BACI|nr:alpha/beta fold hydrolase [Ornithinibacillus hominis]MBC5636430.1 alpha/beta fold hydrolase [Ornithinibacillus hominis]